MKTYTVDEDRLRGNADQASQYADDVRTWADQFDDPAYYDEYARAMGPIGAANLAALQEHGRLIREAATGLANSFDNFAQLLRMAETDLAGTDQVADLALDLREVLLSRLDASARRGAHVQPHHAGVHRWKEILSHREHQAD